ncbi:glycosyltransferase family 2 protein [Bradyrhizobium diazoefficiens]|jgi:glycosyltransferase involved in cell wall biosynthesis|nr:glycosyltransferase family 2 protein [Bradyrhizobium diazoefficiens]MBR0965832.1 glycosyltransferase family 2 protein [Bradyrhizobium diazoefficiens]MBR0975871.1 glycosyltransferase family 2 protein [Bradyrhizobium diazoefficiens]MBR1008839.1 glycosyltransferase family 2 protein [Bradyrhizobium diazoefficiens]MBR1015109.1 glycosyltransferase family 2 protein [Bradyrhizobium diazoefficiens]MBR1052782.1 glycosyltransferase family 2 protein [Bradyrhizobium diazoefficiens]
MLKISVVAPVYNQPSGTLVELVQRLSVSISTITGDFEIILVDDGSINDAWSTIGNLAQTHPNVRGFHLARNFGQHVAITAGLDHANGDWVVVMDADLQDRPEVIPDLYAKAQQGYDVVFVERSERTQSFVYRMTAAAFYLILNALSGEEYNRLQGNFSIVSAKAVQAFRLLREPGRFYGGMLRWVGFRHGSITSPHAGADQSSYSLSRRIGFAIGLIVNFSTRLLYISIVFGLVMAAVSFLIGCHIIIEKILYPDLPPQGWTSVITAIFFTAGVTNVAIGLTGIYIGQILQQTRGRPLYVIAGTAGLPEPPENS